MSKKISMSEKKFRKARSLAWMDGHERGLASGYRDGEAYGRDAMNAEVASTVIAPVLDAAIGLIESNLEDYAHVLLVALRDKAREIGGELSPIVSRSDRTTVASCWTLARRRGCPSKAIRPACR